MAIDTDLPPAPTPVLDPPRGSVRRVSAAVVRLLWRLVLTGYALLAIGQPVLAGAYLSGNYDAIRTHRIDGGSLEAVTILAVVVTLVHWLVGRAKAWPLAVLLALFGLQAEQIHAGYTHDLAVHIPLGVAIVALVSGLAIWSWTPHARRPGWFWRRRSR